MTQPNISNPLTSYVDNPSVPLVQAFQEIAGDNLENLDKCEVWDIITVLCSAASLAESFAEDSIEISEITNDEDFDLHPSKLCEKCLETLEGLPLDQVNPLMIGLLSVNKSHN